MSFFGFRLDFISRNFSQTLGLHEQDTITYVSIHARRTDYANHLSVLYKLEYVANEYFFKAIQYFRSKYTVSFVLDLSIFKKVYNAEIFFHMCSFKIKISFLTKVNKYKVGCRGAVQLGVLVLGHPLGPT